MQPQGPANVNATGMYGFQRGSKQYVRTAKTGSEPEVLGCLLVRQIRAAMAAAKMCQWQQRADECVYFHPFKDTPSHDQIDQLRPYLKPGATDMTWPNLLWATAYDLDSMLKASYFVDWSKLAQESNQDFVRDFGYICNLDTLTLDYYNGTVLVQSYPCHDLPQWDASIQACVKTGYKALPLQPQMRTVTLARTCITLNTTGQRTTSALTPTATSTSTTMSSVPPLIRPASVNTPAAAKKTLTRIKPFKAPAIPPLRAFGAIPKPPMPSVVPATVACTTHANTNNNINTNTLRYVPLAARSGAVIRQ